MSLCGHVLRPRAVEESSLAYRPDVLSCLHSEPLLHGPLRAAGSEPHGQETLQGRTATRPCPQYLGRQAGSAGRCHADREGEARRRWRHSGRNYYVCHIRSVRGLTGRGLLRTAMSLDSGLVLRFRSDTTHYGCVLEGVGGHWLLSGLGFW